MLSYHAVIQVVNNYCTTVLFEFITSMTFYQTGELWRNATMVYVFMYSMLLH